MQIITLDQLKQRLDAQADLALIDVQDERAFRRCHLPGALHVSVSDQFEEKILAAAPHKDKPAVVYGEDQNGPQAAEAVRRMEELGYHTVILYEGGRAEWVEAGYVTTS